MNDCVARIITELMELEDKTRKLDYFIAGSNFKNLAKKQRLLLKEQSLVMRRYADILNTRLASQ